jgi:hypothetical protein
MTDTLPTDLLSADLQQLLQLFSSLPSVTFPELDPTSLQTDVARIKERYLELLHIEAQLAAVRSALDDEQEALLKKGHRLHAYLTVFAENDESLGAKVEALSLPRLRRPAAPSKPVEVLLTAEGEPVPAPAPKKRGRPRKVSTTDALFAEQVGAAAAAS